MRLPFVAASAAALLLACLASCARAPRADGETVLLDERIPLVRGESLDTATREWIAPADGTCVALVEEDDAELVLEMQAAAAGGTVTKVEVASYLLGEGIEVAAVPVLRGSKFSILLSTPPYMAVVPGAPTRVLCYDQAAQEPAVHARVEALRAWSEATLRGAASEESTKRRRALFDAAIARLESLGDARLAAWARLAKGSTLHATMLDLRGALDEFRAAEHAFAALPDPQPRNVARARYQYAAALVEILNDGAWKNPTAAEAKLESTRMFTGLAAASSPLSAVEKARAINYLGAICFETADYDCAIRRFEAAADASGKAGHRLDALRTLQNLGVTANELGNYADAARYFDRAVPLIEKSYSPTSYGTWHVNAGLAYSNLGDTTRAITHMLLALEAARERASALELGRVAHGLGTIYWRRGDVHQAETFYAEALKQRRKASDATGIVGSLGYMGRLARERGRVHEALAMHREALERSSMPDMKLRATYEVVLDLAAAGQLDRAIAQSRAALADAASVHPLRRAQMQLALAQYLVEGRPAAAAIAEARQITRAVLKVALEKSDTVLEVKARHVLAASLAARGELAAARREYERAIAVILDFRGSTGSPELQAATLEHEQETFREYVDLLMRGAVARGAARFSPAWRDAEDALRVLELARSSSASPARDAQLDAANRSRIDGLLQQMAAKRVRIAALTDRATPDEKTLELLQLDMSRLRAEVDRLRGGGVAARRRPKLPGHLDRPWPSVAGGVTQLSYALGRRHAYLWARDAQGLRVAVLAEPPARIERSLAAFDAIDEVGSPAKVEQTLAELSVGLLPPGTLGDRSHALEIVAEGRLGTLPFAALRVPGSGRRVVETHAVRMIASMFDVATPPAGRPRALEFVGIAGNTGRLRSAAHVFPGLGAARAEARAIAALFAAGKDATQVKLLTAADGDAEGIRALWSGGAHAVHFATHALADLRYPPASLLLLPKGGSEEAAYLTAGQVQEWRGDAGLVFLAACETAAGPARFAEGMSGLPRSFLGAGAQGVIATLWPVEDVYESDFSVEFYRRFIVSRDAETSLAETQRAWLPPRAGASEADHQRRLVTAWAHVFHARPKTR